jgi:hypothetical protein
MARRTKKKPKLKARPVPAPTRIKKGGRFPASPRMFLDCGSPKKGCKITRRPAGAKIANFPGFHYTTRARPCGETKEMRKTCPVQLFYKRGQPMLRFCHKTKTAGRTLSVDSPQQAQRIASAACKCWTKSHKDPKKRSFDKCRVLKDAGLGKAKKKRR